MTILLWPLIGIVFLYLATPRWMMKSDPFGFALMHFLACVVGPFGVIWLLIE